MEFDSYYLTSYLHKHFLINPSEVKISSNLKADFGIKHNEISDLLDYLEAMQQVKFPHKRAADQYEYVFEIYLYFLLGNMHVKQN